MQVKNVFTSLLSSRKFWLALLAFIGALIMYIQGSIPAEQLVDFILKLVAAVVAAIAVEDMASKLRGG